jgi:hypothetical protein
MTLLWINLMSSSSEITCVSTCELSFLFISLLREHNFSIEIHSCNPRVLSASRNLVNNLNGEGDQGPLGLIFSMVSVKASCANECLHSY